jgi:hypothetical protein
LLGFVADVGAEALGKLAERGVAFFVARYRDGDVGVANDFASRRKVGTACWQAVRKTAVNRIARYLLMVNGF